MIVEIPCINVYSKTNLWIDFCILVNDKSDFEMAKNIVSKAYDDWWKLSEAEDEPLADYVSRCLTENGIDFEIYFKNGEEEER